VVYVALPGTLVGSLSPVYMPATVGADLVHTDGLLGTAVLARGSQVVGRGVRNLSE